MFCNFSFAGIGVGEARRSKGEKVANMVMMSYRNMVFIRQINRFLDILFLLNTMTYCVFYENMVKTSRKWAKNSYPFNIPLFEVSQNILRLNNIAANMGVFGRF